MSGGAALTPAIAALVLFGAFFTLMALRVPIAFALGLACLPVMVIEPPETVASVAVPPRPAVKRESVIVTDAPVAESAVRVPSP